MKKYLSTLVILFIALNSLVNALARSPGSGKGHATELALCHEYEFIGSLSSDVSKAPQLFSVSLDGTQVTIDLISRAEDGLKLLSHKLKSIKAKVVIIKKVDVAEFSARLLDFNVVVPVAPVGVNPPIAKELKAKSSRCTSKVW